MDLLLNKQKSLVMEANMSIIYTDVFTRTQPEITPQQIVSVTVNVKKINK